MLADVSAALGSFQAPAGVPAADQEPVEGTGEALDGAIVATAAAPGRVTSGGVHVTPDSLDASGQHLAAVAERFASALTAFQAEIAGYGQPWGADDIGSLIGAAHDEVASFAFESYQDARDRRQPDPRGDLHPPGGLIPSGPRRVLSPRARPSADFHRPWLRAVPSPAGSPRTGKRAGGAARSGAGE
ncbi:hypothetical protein [Actinoplanes palleronii]|uniref:PE domain-containing protein n=1 Tax=Actinoplanes palleronii TaxID=113570 RepID=A0ABQ4BR93_9ACTN|nr:hypothetical protein [Actinoplanes palleronii]GIE73188.1 hypothetical protein Apa02nite_092960 [Actinoplanes palleronii]